MKTGACIVLAVLSAGITSTAWSELIEVPPTPRRVAVPLVMPAFESLSPGAVKPQGWLRDWAEAASRGITGHLDEWSPVYGDGWKGVRIEGPQLETNGTWGSLEQCSYYLDGALRLGYILHDPALMQKATNRLNLVVDGVNRGGKSFIYWSQEPPIWFRSWACSQMGRALVAYYQATGDKRILDALVRAYADYPLPRERIKFDDVSGLCNLDPMLETYSYSGDKRVLDQVMAAVKSPGVKETFQAWADQQYDAGHAVCTYEKLRLPILLYPWTGEQRYRQGSLGALQWLKECHLLPYGMTSGEENLSGIGAFRLTETCDVAAQIWTEVWMYRIEGERIYGDDLERSFFNAGPAPIARDFQTMCYYQSPNRIEPENLPGEQPKAPGKGCLKFTRLGYPGVLCCVGAVNRILPNFIMHLWMATEDHGLAATLYGPCSVTALAGANIPVRLTSQTAYPFEESIRVTVEPEQKADFPLYFRVPSWCANARISINGSWRKMTPDAKGFVRVKRTWSRGDTVKLIFPMSVKLSYGHETEYPLSNREYFSFKPDEVFQKRRFPFESVSYGPLLFALPIPDIDANTRVAEARWQFALDTNPNRNGADIRVKHLAMPAKWDWPLNAPVALYAPARAFDWRPTNDQALPATCVEGGKQEMIRLVPYGCTKFRISMFPVTARAWAQQTGP